MDGYEFGSIGEGSLGLDFVDHFGDAFHDVIYELLDISNSLATSVGFYGPFNVYTTRVGCVIV